MLLVAGIEIDRVSHQNVWLRSTARYFLYSHSGQVKVFVLFSHLRDT